jgi:hypothetical protein
MKKLALALTLTLILLSCDNDGMEDQDNFGGKQ